MIKVKTEKGVERKDKEKEALYRLIISQLFYDGHQTLAVSLSNLIKTHPPCPPSDRLFKVVTLGSKGDLDKKPEQDAMKPDIPNVGIGIDLEYEVEAPPLAPSPALYETIHVDRHNAQCHSGTFTNDGALLAIGARDTTIRIFDVELMITKNAISKENVQPIDCQPEIRVLSDHLEEVTCMEFHPTEPILVSGSRDYTVKFFNYSKLPAKRAFRVIYEADSIRTIALHPSGNSLIVGTHHPIVRLYDVRTSQCFISEQKNEQHKGPINMVRFSPNAYMYATCSKDGSIKVWDSVSNRCFNTFPNAHNGSDVCSVQFSRNSKYLLSSGKDSVVKLWELSMSRCLIAYIGPGGTGKQLHSSQACFNHTEEFVMCPDERTNTLCSWDARSGEPQHPLPLGHTKFVHYFTHSPLTPAFVTCSEDFSARFWYNHTEPRE